MALRLPSTMCGSCAPILILGGKLKINQLCTNRHYSGVVSVRATARRWLPRSKTQAHTPACTRTHLRQRPSLAPALAPPAPPPAPAAAAPPPHQHQQPRRRHPISTSNRTSTSTSGSAITAPTSTGASSSNTRAGTQSRQPEGRPDRGHNVSCVVVSSSRPCSIDFPIDRKTGHTTVQMVSPSEYLTVDHQQRSRSRSRSLNQHQHQHQHQHQRRRQQQR